MKASELFRLRLYVADKTLNSNKARANLATICKEHLAGRSVIEVVDVLIEPQRAFEDGIFMTPTLVKLGPGPVCSLVGTLSQTDRVLDALGVNAVAA